MNHTLRLAALGCIGLSTFGTEASAQPVLVPPGAPAAADRPSDTVYVIRRDGGEENAGDAPSREAIEGRHRALEQFRLGDQAFRRGQTQDAVRIYAPLKNDAYLTAPERVQVARICEQLERNDARRANTMQGTSNETNAAARQDPDQVLSDARQALGMKNYERAEQLATQAQQLGHRSILPWSDTPAKVLHDVKEARSQPVPTAGPPKPGPVLLAQAPLPGEAGRQPAQGPRQTGTPNEMTPQRNQPPARAIVRTESDPLAQRTSSARALLEQAHLYVQAGDYPRARQLLREAESLRVTLPWWEDFTPEKVRLEITRAELVAKTRSREAPAVVKSTPVQERSVERTAEKPPGRQEPSAVVQASAVISERPAERSASKPSSARPDTHWPPQGTDPKALVAEARKQIQAGQLDHAVDYAKQAQLVPGVRWGHFEDSPERILNDVAKARQELSDRKASELLADSRRLLNQGRLEEAERLTYQAESLRPEYPLIWRGEKHDRLRIEIADKRRALTKTQLPPLVEPTKSSAEPMKQPVTVVKSARPGQVDSPWRLLEPRKPESEIIASAPPRGAASSKGRAATMPSPADVIARSEARGDAGVRATVRPEGTPTGTGRPGFGPVATEAYKPIAPIPEINGADTNPSSAPQRPAEQNEPSVTDAGSAKKASQHLAEARQQQKDGLLLEALAAWQLAKNCHGSPGQLDDVTDELLDRMYTELQRDAQAQVVAFSAAVQTLTTKGHYRDAERYLKYMQTLAGTFEIDTQKVVEQVVQASGPRVDGSLPPPQKLDPSVLQAQAPESDARSRELLEDARREARVGNHAKARRLAEALYLGSSPLRAQAKDLLAEIDEAEFRDGVRKAQAQYELGAQAFARRDVAGAALYLQGLDVRLLNDQAKDHVREMLASKELYQRVGHTGAGAAPVNVTVIVNTPGVEPIVVTPDLTRRLATPPGKSGQ